VTTVQFDIDHEGVAHEVFLPEGPLAILPLTERRANIVWSQSAASARTHMQAPDADFDAALAKALGSFLGAVSRVGPRYAYPVGLEVAAEWVRPRFALVGDSAHTIHPVAGQGLNLGLKDVAALADVLAEAVRLGQDPGDLAVLERYARWRRFDTISMAVGTDMFIRTFSNRIAPLRALGRFGLAAADRLSPLRRFFMGEASGTRGELPSLLQASS
jgi:2-octaprenyl-6-methoxyphenol hydroxylase